MKRRPLLVALAAAAALLATAAPGFAAESWPARPVTLVVPYSPGGATDTIARIVARHMAEKLGQPMVVDNKPGAGTEIGATLVARAPADGYTLLISSNTTFTVNPALKSKLSYSPEKSFESIGIIGSSPLMLLAQPGFPAGDIKGLVAQAKARPGKISYASFGAGTTSHLAGEMLKVMAGIDLLHVPYKGSSPAMADLVGGQVDLSVDTLVAAIPMIKGGKVKALAITSPKRSPQLPAVPTVAEAGYADYEMVAWITIVAPRGLPPAVQQKLSSTLAQVVAEPAARAALEQAGMDLHYQPGSAFEARVARELPLLRAYVSRARISFE
jgi:tripartite-type tricarboxylate transporter receptor subunit TctC